MCRRAASSGRCQQRPQFVQQNHREGRIIEQCGRAEFSGDKGPADLEAGPAGAESLRNDGWAGHEFGDLDGQLVEVTIRPRVLV